MKPFYIVIKGTIPLMIVPEKNAGVDVHPTQVRNYRIYRNHDQAVLAVTEYDDNKNYTFVGSIEVLTPGRSYQYRKGTTGKLSFFEVKDVVDQINDYRDTPGLWQLSPINVLANYTDVCAVILRKIKFSIAAFEQKDLTLSEQSALIKNIRSLRAEYNLIQTEILNSQACLV